MSRAVIEKLAQSDRENETSVGRMFERRGQDGARAVERAGEKQPPLAQPSPVERPVPDYIGERRNLEKLFLGTVFFSQ